MFIASKDGQIYFRNSRVQIYDSKVSIEHGLSLNGWIISGILVGIGTKLGNGCTSGHGVCGLSRFSTRSLVAV